MILKIYVSRLNLIFSVKLNLILIILSASSLNLPNLKELDLRNCKIKIVHKNLLENLKKLEYLYLSNNNIVYLDDDSFHVPSLIHLDLSFNQEETKDGVLPNPLKMTPKVFEKLTKLKFLDFSHTKIEGRAIPSLESLSSTLIGISLCYTELQTTGDDFLFNLTTLKFLDVSGNTQLNLTKSTFHTISTTLERLDARDANVEKLDWTKPLINLRVLNLNDNKIRYLDNNSFSHMLYLEDLNLEKNSLGSWYSRLFKQNQELKTLNLRENAIQIITEDMIEDFLNVRHLAIGKNKFECSCSLYGFMLKLFEATKNADMTQLQNRFNFGYSDFESTTTPHTVSIGMRSNFRPEYDIMSRTYQKFYDQILRSIEALNKQNYIKKTKLLSQTDVKRLNDSSFHTVLFDYDENNEDYQCMNVTEKQKQSLLDLIDFCDDEYLSEKDPPYSGIDDFFVITLSTSLSLVIIFFLLLFIIYWKWWYIRYFCIICKNSAILSFMTDDYDEGKETIVRKKSSSSIDLFLYDVFVSYSDYNRPWVLDEFIPNIEKRESINVCLHERDFTVGHGILENIISCMDRSRCLLLLISEKFLESQWCQFEMNLAQHRLLETRKEKLIVVLLEDIPPKNQPKTLRYLTRTKTYIKWPENGSNDEKQLFWKRLKKSIISTKWEHENYGSTA
jgi:Leucine-rich repeat (LRR) protein